MLGVQRRTAPSSSGRAFPPSRTCSKPSDADATPAAEPHPEPGVGGRHLSLVVSGRAEAGGAELRRRYKEARRLCPDEPGGDKERYLAEMEALHADAEAYGEPGILFEIRIEYAYSMGLKGWTKHSREAVAPRLRVLRKSLTVRTR